MDHLYPDMLKVNSNDDIQRWWEVIDRTTGEVVPVSEWDYSDETGDVTIHGAKKFHDYTVSFLAYIMWDPVHMYNAVHIDLKLAKEMVDLTHELGKEAMVFLGDHWIGTEPFMEEFKSIGLDAVVGSVGNGSTLRLISDIPNVKYTEGRFLPYFFPDTFHEGGDPVKEAKVNWVTARRAILRKPIDRIGYGGYLKLALEFPEFIDYVESVCDEFRTLYENIKGTTPYCVKTVAVLNSWGKMRAWGNHMVHHALYQKQNYSYAGILLQVVSSDKMRFLHCIPQNGEGCNHKECYRHGL